MRLVGRGLTLWHLEGASPASETRPWEGKEAELRELLSRSSQAPEFEAIKYPRSGLCHLLGRLSQDFPERVVYHRTAKARFWIIRPPG
jgi:hypothetical protein